MQSYEVHLFINALLMSYELCTPHHSPSVIATNPLNTSVPSLALVLWVLGVKTSKPRLRDAGVHVEILLLFRLAREVGVVQQFHVRIVLERVLERLTISSTS
jgi:hypothetical protein